MKTSYYNRLWRWHFYAALFIAPLLITLTLSGIGYLFYTNVENKAYDHLFFGNSASLEKLAIDEGIEKAVQLNKGYSVAKVIVLDDPYNTRLTMTNQDGDQKYVFLDDHYEVVGTQNAKYTFSNMMREIHSSLFVGGTAVNYLVELAACWAIFLLLTGLYMTMKSRALKKRKNSSKRQKSRKWHAWVGTVITIPMIIIIFTGLPWSVFMGDFIYSAAQKHPSIGTPMLKQQPPESDRSEIPWATRKNKAPSSEVENEHHAGMQHMQDKQDQSAMISIEQLINKADEATIQKPYTINYPSTEKGVYTVSKSSNTGITGLDVNPDDEMTAYFDQYSGKFLSKVGYKEYGILAKWFTWGIPLHEGHLFGWPNKLLNLAVCLSFLLVIFLGMKTWLTRKRKGELSAPPVASNGLSISFVFFMVFLGMIMPLFGLSLIAVAFIEGVLYIKKKEKKERIAS
ncbi:PepSY-associated TM helix domain-containing protein [Fictibacillus fluitans]|uniref:PepSY domain-containing protein n=1 Tax=Fictibacillus fluitans TaxID=3058422 RepID=A0ABT8I070_9BACL|nr:PepSY domain-containing protein [Fictibacillus sp. NE201]MDN4526354.1 PepSY domain-containing protein [Fictibacillus sp. NE201]